jgi:phage terminase large subunit
MSRAHLKTVMALAERAIAQRSTSGTPVSVHQRVGESIAAVDERALAAQATGRLVIETSGPRDAPSLPGIVHNTIPECYLAALDPDSGYRDVDLHGGRGAGRSRSTASCLAVRAAVRKTLVLCAREFQNSLADSALRLLGNQIETLGLSRFFDVQRETIIGNNGSQFLFKGLRSNVSSLKSLEGADVLWVEQAETVSNESWDTVRPSMRAPGSRIIVTWNPDGETDPTFQRYVTSPPPNSISVHSTWRDNPWFPRELEAERAYLAAVDADAHSWIWEGKTRAISDAQVFRGKYVSEPFEAVPGWSGPHYGADWGFNDPSCLVRCWINGTTLYIDHEAWAVQCDIDKLPALFDGVPGARQHVIRGDSARPEVISFMQQHGYAQITPVAKHAGSVESGVAFLRSFEKIVVHPRCQHVLEEMRLYRYRVDRLSGDVLPDLVDRFNHTIDSLRYATAPLVQNTGANGFLSWLAAENQRDAATQHVALVNRPGVVVTSLTGEGNH